MDIKKIIESQLDAMMIDIVKEFSENFKYSNVFDSVDKLHNLKMLYESIKIDFDTNVTIVVRRNGVRECLKTYHPFSAIKNEKDAAMAIYRYVNGDRILNIIDNSILV